MARYALGIDFGTLSGRAVVVDVETGREAATAVMDYPHGVIDDVLPATGAKLPPDWALQDARDYLDVLFQIVPEALKQAGAQAEDIVGIGVDFTACTMMPVVEGQTPLSFGERWKPNPHAYVKLWKHHAAQPEANRINELAGQRGEEFLQRYGGKSSSEWFLAKAWQILDEAPEVYEAAESFIEAGDWMVLVLTGQEKRSACQAGYKGMWSAEDGYPSREFLAALDPRLENLVDEKMSREVYPVASRAGTLRADLAEKLGLKAGTPVAVASIDAHVAVPACTVTSPGRMVMIMGTSTCHMALSEEPKVFEGLAGYVQDGIIPGYIGFEAGQSCVGDHFAWFVERCVPASYQEEAAREGVSVHDLLSRKAAELRPGESGLLALDWWNGNRSVLMDADLSGLMVGMNLNTKPEEVYRALVEATAFGTLVIINTFADNGVPVDEIVACGGLAEKNPVLMQIYADITGRELKIAASGQAVAVGSAIFGAVAAGSAGGGFDTIQEAAERMGGLKDEHYTPDPENHALYQVLYKEYLKLHDTFGRGANEVMKTLKAMRQGEAPAGDRVSG